MAGRCLRSLAAGPCLIEARTTPPAIRKTAEVASAFFEAQSARNPRRSGVTRMGRGLTVSRHRNP